MTNNKMTTNTVTGDKKSHNKGIVFDASCGISEEEQREIFAQINRITEKNRLSLAASAAAASAGSEKGKKKKQFKAKKSGGLFPVVVNAAAIAVLAGGFIILYAFQGKTNAEVREGARVYNSAERALIGELVSEQSAAARGELEQLSREQTQAAAVEAQMGAFFANLSRAINENKLEEASTIIRSMRDFLNTPAFQGLRSIQARKDLYAQAINSFEIMVNELRRTQAALASGIMSLDRSAEATFAQLQETTAQLERDLDRERIRANSLQTQSNTLQANLERETGRANTLQTQNNTLQTNLERETGRANTLQDQLTTRDATIRTQTATIANRNAVVEQIRNIIQGGKALDDITFNELRESTERIQAALQSLN
jgi:chromosome segregation ATPase